MNRAALARAGLAAASGAFVWFLTGQARLAFAAALLTLGAVGWPGPPARAVAAALVTTGLVLLFHFWKWPGR